jgi:hypothetical protein
MLACDATVRPLLHRQGTPIDVGRSRRLVTSAQRRALRARDGGCVFPGCGHARFVDAHHVDHWLTGGPTDLANLVLLCRHHHRGHHRGEYRIRTTSVPGRFQFVEADGGRIIGAPPDPIRIDPATIDRRTGITPTWLTPHAKQCREVHLGPAIDGLLDAALAGAGP